MLEVESIATPIVGNAFAISAVNWSGEADTQIVVRNVETGERARIVFTTDCGIRILEELDLASWWMQPTAQGFEKDSWFYKVIRGGWYDFESNRDDFYMKHEGTTVSEFLIKGYRDCVSVIAHDVPVVETIHGI